MERQRKGLQGLRGCGVAGSHEGGVDGGEGEGGGDAGGHGLTREREERHAREEHVDSLPEGRAPRRVRRLMETAHGPQAWGLQALDHLVHEPLGFRYSKVGLPPPQAVSSGAGGTEVWELKTGVSTERFASALVTCPAAQRRLNRINEDLTGSTETPDRYAVAVESNRSARWRGARKGNGLAGGAHEVRLPVEAVGEDKARRLEPRGGCLAPQVCLRRGRQPQQPEHRARRGGQHLQPHPERFRVHLPRRPASPHPPAPPCRAARGAQGVSSGAP